MATERQAFVLRIAPSGNDRVPESLEANQLIIGWAEAGELLDISLNWNQFREVLRQRYYSTEPDLRRVGNAAGHMWRFIREMRIGDLVVVPHGSHFYVGEITGLATHNPERNRDDTAFRRKVRWLNNKDPIPRELARAALRARMKIKGTSASATDLISDIEESLDLVRVEHESTVPTDSHAGAEVSSGEHTNSTFPKNGDPVSNPTAFVSYSWDGPEHKEWVVTLATRLRRDGVDVTLDVWNLHPGDYLPEFMEREISNSDFVIIVCTPKYRGKSDRRTGGVGFEESIITAEVLVNEAERKFIPVLREGEWGTAAPRWLRGKVYLDLRGEILNEHEYRSLLLTLHQKRESPPPLGAFPDPTVPHGLVGPKLTVTGDLGSFLDRVQGQIQDHNWQRLVELADPRHYEAQVLQLGQDEHQYIAELVEFRVWSEGSRPWEDLNRIVTFEYVYLDFEAYWITARGQFRLRDGTTTDGAIHIISEAGRFILSGAVG